MSAPHRKLVTVTFHHGGVSQRVRIHRGENPDTALRFVFKVMGLPADRARGALTTDDEGVPVCFNPMLMEENTSLFLVLGTDDGKLTRTGGAGAGGGAAAHGSAAAPAPAPAPASASAPALSAPPVASTTASATASVSVRGEATTQPQQSKTDPTADNSACWTWDPKVASLPCNTGTIFLSKKNLAFRAGEYDRCPGNFTMAVIPSSCKFTHGVHRVGLVISPGGGYQGCGIITQAGRNKVSTMDLGRDFTAYPFVRLGLGGRLALTLDMTRRTLVMKPLGGHQSQVFKFPGTGPVWFAATLKTTGMSTCEIVHEITPTTL